MKNIGTGLLVLSSVLLLSSTVLTTINKDNEIEKLKKASVGSETSENKNISGEESENNTGENNENTESNENNGNVEGNENIEENEVIDTPEVTVNELDNIYVVAKDKIALATLTDELQNEINTYFTENGKIELQTYYKTDETGTKICTDVTTCEARDNAFTNNNATYEMEISERNGNAVTTVLKEKNTLEDGTEQVNYRYNIIFKYENDSWKIDAFSK